MLYLVTRQCEGYVGFLESIREKKVFLCLVSP